MIYINNIKNSKNDLFDEVWGIVQSLKNPAPYMIHVPELAPSKELFYWYLQQVKNKTWNKELFLSTYVPWFIRDFTDIGKQRLKQLRHLDIQNKNICLFCFCQNEELCHRSIIAGILQGMGVKVSLTTDYSNYYKQFLNVHGKNKN